MQEQKEKKYRPINAGAVEHKAFQALRVSVENRVDAPVSSVKLLKLMLRLTKEDIDMMPDIELKALVKKL